MDVWPQVCAALAAGLADDPIFDVGETDIVRPLVDTDRGRVAALEIRAVNQDAAHIGFAHSAECDLLMLSQIRLTPFLVSGRITAFVLAAHIAGSFLVARLLLATLIAHDPLIGGASLIGAGPWRWILHAPLAAMLAAHVLRAFQIVLLGHAHSSAMR
jgi:hypothetical protein